MMRFVCNAIIALSFAASLNGMENKHNNRAITSSSITSSLIHNVASYGKHLAYALLPLAAECTSMQDGSFNSNVTVIVPPEGLSGDVITGIAIGASLCGLSLLLCLVGSMDNSNHDNGWPMQNNTRPFGSSPPSSRPSSSLTDMREIMRSISGLPGMGYPLSRYGYGNPRNFFGAYGCQRESAKAIVVYLHQRCAGMPIELQMLPELTQYVGKYVRRIDKAVCKELVAGGYDLTYNDRRLGATYTMVPSTFFWNKGFVESSLIKEQIFYNHDAGDYDIECGGGESTDNEPHDDIERSDAL